MRGFEWAEKHLDTQFDCRLRTLYDLRNRGVEVFVAPYINPERRLVNLHDGRVHQFPDHAPPPKEGYFADLQSLQQFCGARGLPLQQAGERAVLGEHTEASPGD